MTLEPDDGRPRGERPASRTRPGLRPTKPATLAVAALGTGAFAWLSISRFYGDAPDLNVLAGLTLAGLAVVEGVAAHGTRARIERRPGSGPVNPLLVARFAVLAKASSLAGAIFSGAYGGVAIWALAERGRLRVADDNVAPSVIGLVGALALVAAALVLERVCRVPPPPAEEANDAGGGGAPNSQR